MKKYQAQLLEFCETGNVCFLLVPFNKKGYFIEAYLNPKLVPDGMKVEDYAIVELPVKISLKNTEINEATIVFNSSPDMSYFVKEDPFKDIDNAFLNEI